MNLKFDKNHWREKLNKENLFRTLIILTLAAGVFIRFWRLGSVPPGIQYDEAFNGLNAIQALETGDFKLFYTDNYGREGLHINAIALFIRIFGASSFSLRFASALWGSLTLVGFFFLLRELKLSRLSVLLGTFMLAFSFWHLDFSRTAFRGIMVPLVMVWMFYFIFKGANDRKMRWVWFLLAGTLMGLGFYTYIAFRVAPLSVAALAAAYFLTNRREALSRWKTLAFFVAIAFLVALPIGRYFVGHAADFWDRADAVSVFSSKTMSPGAAFLKSLGYHLRAFFVHGDNNPRHNYNGQPLVPIGWVAFLVAGFAISIREIRKTLRMVGSASDDPGEARVTSLFWISVLAQGVFWAMLLPGILTIEGIPHSLRIIGVIPSVFLFSVLPLEYVLKAYRKVRFSADPVLGRRAISLMLAFVVSLASIVVGSGILQSYVYFGIWAKDLRTEDGFERKLYLAGSLANDRDLPAAKHRYFIMSPTAWISSDHKSSSFKTTEYSGYPNIRNYEFHHPAQDMDELSCEDVVFIFFDSDQWLRDQYRAKCNGTLETRKFRFGNNAKYIFYVMQSKQPDQ